VIPDSATPSSTSPARARPGLADLETPNQDGEAPADRPVRRPYVVVFAADSSRMVELPAAGEVRIGRGADAELQIAEVGVSRHHARLRTDDDGAVLIDEGSQNGTRVNGERVVGARPLASGDAIAIGATTLLYHASAPAPQPARVLEPAAFRQRLDQELARACAYHRAVTVAVASLGRADRPRLALALARQLRPLDVAGWGGAHHLLVLMPEVGADDAAHAAAALLAIVEPIAAPARVGFATCPADGIDGDTLIEAARSSALAAPAATAVAATRAFRTLAIGEREVIVADPAMIRHYELIERLARASLTVLVCGETGTGKDVAARALHAWSARRAAPLVAINCAAISDTLFESELFGHARGAFTGAVEAKPGLLERADGGTVFLDEVGELSAAAQAKLLRALEHKRVTRIGEAREREIDIRLVAATNRDLAAEIAAGRFRQDLYFRLSVARIWVPPLRDRPREIAILARQLLAQACARAGAATKTLSEDALRRLSLHPWPGNVRELMNLMERAAAIVEAPVVEAWDLDGLDEAPAGDADAPREPGAAARPALRPIDQEVRALERAHMAAALQATGGHQRRAAALISMPLRTFQTKAKQFGLTSEPRGRR
jgi:two-component system, NtrC family, response regulator AtoC